MKYAILVGDGMSDISIPELNGKTPVEYANTPAMDSIAENGSIGLVKTVPEGYPPGSDVANMSLMGYYPVDYYTGRSPIEAASLHVDLAENETAFRCNLVNIHDGVMNDYSAGHIETEYSVKIIEELANALNSEKVKFYPGVSYRHLLIVKDFPSGDFYCSPPHDITDENIEGHFPKGSGSDFILDLMKKARRVLLSSDVNKELSERGKTIVSDVWLWGQGKSRKFPTLKERYNLSGSVISAVDLVKGLGVLSGLNVRIVEGATGYLGTNYAGKVAAAKNALKNEDFVYIHVEAPDETSHEGDLKKKLQAIEEFDRFVVAEMVKLQGEIKDLRLIVLPDHKTLISTKTHDARPVPFAVSGTGVNIDESKHYSEFDAEKYCGKEFTGVSLFSEFINGNFGKA